MSKKRPTEPQKPLFSDPRWNDTSLPIVTGYAEGFTPQELEHLALLEAYVRERKQKRLEDEAKAGEDD